MTIRLTIPVIEDDDIRAVAEVLASGFLVQGARVAEFESQVAEYLGVRNAVAVSNCTAALHLGLLALNVRPGDRVAVSCYSWPATANVIVLAGAEPVFVDIDPVTFNMDPARLEEALSSRSGIRAILPVHAFGGMAPLERINEVAGRHGIPVLEDAACALGADQDGKRAGAWGDAGCFSFHPRKAITTGEGGMFVTECDDLAREVRVLRNHGLDPDAGGPDFIAAGYNLRLTEFQAALGISQLRKLDRLLSARGEAAGIYDRLLDGTAVASPGRIPGSKHVYQSYVVLLPRDATPDRDRIIVALRAEGIETTVGTYHIPLTRWYRDRYGFTADDFAVGTEMAARALTLPLYPGIAEEDQRRVVSRLLAFV